MKKALFLIFHGFDPSNGISKKIGYQVDALRACGMEVMLAYMDERQGKRRMIDQEVVADYGTGLMGKILKRTDFRAVVRKAREQAVDLVYIRSNHNANPFTIHMVRQLRRAGIRVVMEIPTYPYDQEYRAQHMMRQIMTDRIFRHWLAREVDAIVTFSDYERIFGQRTIRISNGISFEQVPLKKNSAVTDELRLIGVAEIHRWHGFDRVVKGLAAYYGQQPTLRVHFHVVGYFFTDNEEQEFRQLIAELGVANYVTLHGRQHGEALNELFDLCHFGIGSLGRHRVGIDRIKTLKNREYAARGIPFVYSETDSDFDQQPYVLKAPADESALDIAQIVDFQQALQLTAEEIRQSIKHLSWQHQMQHVLNAIGL